MATNGSSWGGLGKDERPPEGNGLRGALPHGLVHGRVQLALGLRQLKRVDEDGCWQAAGGFPCHPAKNIPALPFV